MNYTELYKELYPLLKKKNITHHEAHIAAIKIADTIFEIYHKSKNSMDDCVKTVKELAQLQ